MNLQRFRWESKRYRALKCGLKWRGVDEEEKPMLPHEIGELMGGASRATIVVNCVECKQIWNFSAFFGPGSECGGGGYT